MKLVRALVLAATAAVAASACGGGSQESGNNTTTGPAAGSAVPFDQAFIDAMIPHHRDAVEMAEAARERGLTQPDLQKIAADIIDSQQAEIDQMLDWRERWFGSRQLGPLMPEVLGVSDAEMGMEHGSGDEIAGAVDVDAKFAQMMIPHHEGAIAMATVAQDRAEHEEIETLAAAIIAAQEREIGVLQKHAGGEHHGS
ncbi:MAG: DUF305 domain-containing protein [Gaiellales bacterium]